jgi:hypothetical protein
MTFAEARGKSRCAEQAEKTIQRRWSSFLRK